jgi:hypothetical protein
LVALPEPGTARSHHEALNDWHMNTYHKHAKEWAVRSGAIMEDVITNFEFKRARLIRVCPTCANIQDKPFDLHIEQAYWPNLAQNAAIISQ